MADSPDTTTPSRRLFLAAGSAAAVFGSLHAVAQEAPSKLSVEERQLMLENYQSWLIMELSHLEDELGSICVVRPNSAAGKYHRRRYGEAPAPVPSTRAEAVLAAVGCEWRQTRGGAHV